MRFGAIFTPATFSSGPDRCGFPFPGWARRRPGWCGPGCGRSGRHRYSPMPLARVSRRPLRPVNPRSKIRGRSSGCDAHAGVPDAQVIAVHGDGHGAADGVFQGVGQHLLHHEAQPLGVGDHGAVQGLIVQPQTAADELPGELPHRPGARYRPGCGSGSHSRWCCCPAAGTPAPSPHTAPPASDPPDRERARSESSFCRVRRMEAMGVLIWWAHMV